MKRFALLLLLLLVACTTTSKSQGAASVSDAGVDSVVGVTCVSLNALGKSFLATGTVLDAAFDAKLITPKGYLPWHDFALRFSAAYAVANKACTAAINSNDQSVQGVIAAEMGAFQTQLAAFIAQAVHVGTDGGIP